MSTIYISTIKIVDIFKKVNIRISSPLRLCKGSVCFDIFIQIIIWKVRE